MIPFSVLDLSPVLAGSDAGQSFRNTLDLAQHAERWQYQRYWLAEHHNMPGIASAATAVVIGHVAAGTSTIRVGAGGIMLPNHAPLIIAEQFGTLAALFPGRIDLGLGRAPGTDPLTMRALRRHHARDSGDTFPQDVRELQNYFGAGEAEQKVRAYPGHGLDVPIWLLGSSLFSAHLAAELGLPFAFASHFAPDYLLPALRAYRQNFQPSAVLQKPHAMAGLNVFAADSNAEARALFSSLQQQFVSLRRGRPGPLQPPAAVNSEDWSDIEKAGISHALALAVVGGPAHVQAGIEHFLAETGIDELMITAQIHDHAARLRSFEIVADIRDRLAAREAG